MMCTHVSNHLLSKDVGEKKEMSGCCLPENWFLSHCHRQKGAELVKASVYYHFILN